MYSCVLRFVKFLYILSLNKHLIKWVYDFISVLLCLPKKEAGRVIREHCPSHFLTVSPLVPAELWANSPNLGSTFSICKMKTVNPAFQGSFSVYQDVYLSGEETQHSG